MRGRNLVARSIQFFLICRLIRLCCLLIEGGSDFISGLLISGCECIIRVRRYWLTIVFILILCFTDQNDDNYQYYDDNDHNTNNDDQSHGSVIFLLSNFNFSILIFIICVSSGSFLQCLAFSV